jgi:hypothetical protein
MLDFYSSHDFQHVCAFYIDHIWSELSPRCWVYSSSSLVFFVFFIFDVFDLFVEVFMSFYVFGKFNFFSVIVFTSFLGQTRIFGSVYG